MWFDAQAGVEILLECWVKLFDAPTAEISIKERGIYEHVLHAPFSGFVLRITDCGGVPITEVLIKEPRSFKHAAHVGDIAGVPLPY